MSPATKGGEEDAGKVKSEIKIDEKKNIAEDVKKHQTPRLQLGKRALRHK